MSLFYSDIICKILKYNIKILNDNQNSIIYYEMF